MDGDGKSPRGFQDPYAQPQPQTSVGFQPYPNLPPAYTSAVQPLPGNPPLAAAASNPSPFVALPPARYDTMTSYMEDGSGTATIVTTGAILDRPLLIRCPFCKTTVTTKTRHISGALTWLVCIGLCLVGCTFGCCLIPFCSDRLRDVEHTCPSCRNVVALYKRL